MSQHKRRAVGDTPFPLLLLPPGVIVENLLPCLRPKERGALACSSHALRSLVQASVKRLVLPGSSCCLVAGNPLASKMPALAALKVTPANLHEAMYTIPTFLLQVGRNLKGMTSLTWHDGLPDSFEGRVKCPTCAAWTNTYDLAALLVTAATCLPQLRHLDFVTHYVSDAECSAIALMTGLTQLRLGGHHGWRRGGLRVLSTLTALRSLTLLDNGRSASGADAATLAGLPHLTQLRLGFCPGLVAALLPALAEAAPAAAPQQQQREGSSGAAALSSAVSHATLPALPAGGGGSSISSAGSSPRPVLRCLELSVSHPDVWWSEPELRSIAGGWHLHSVWRLVGLTRLVIGGLLEEVPGGWQGPGLPLACQQGVSGLVGLVELVLDWAVPEELLPSLEALTALTLLEVGALPQPRAPLPTRLPSLRALVAGLAPPHATCPAMPPSPWLAAAHLALHADPAQQVAWTHVLAATPQLTRLQLSGVVHGAALPRLAAACPHLAQLLLPARSVALGPAQLRSLSSLTRLTQLRLGWRSSSTQGPAPAHPLVGAPTLAGLLPADMAAALGAAMGPGPERSSTRIAAAPEQQQQQQQDIDDDLVLTGPQPASSSGPVTSPSGHKAVALTPPWPFAGSSFQQELPPPPPLSSSSSSRGGRHVHVPRRAQQDSSSASAAVARLQQLAARAAHHAAGGLPRAPAPAASSTGGGGLHLADSRSQPQGTSSTSGSAVDLPAAALAALQQAAGWATGEVSQYVAHAAALSAALRLRLAAGGCSVPGEHQVSALVQQLLEVVTQQLQGLARRSCEQQQEEEVLTAGPTTAAAAAAAGGNGGGGGNAAGAPAWGGAAAAAAATAAAKNWRWRALQVATAGQQLLLALLLLSSSHTSGVPGEHDAAAPPSEAGVAGDVTGPAGLEGGGAVQWLAAELAAGVPGAGGAARRSGPQLSQQGRKLWAMASTNAREQQQQPPVCDAEGRGAAPPDAALVALVAPLAAAAVDILLSSSSSSSSSSACPSTAPKGSSLTASSSCWAREQPQEQRPVVPFQSLRCLELVGPVPPAELLLVGLLPPSLHQLALTDNANWGSGRPPAELLALAEAAGEERSPVCSSSSSSSSRVCSSSITCHLRHLLVRQCPGLTPDLEQQLWQVSGGRLEALVSPAVALGDWARVSHGWAPPEVTWEGWGGAPLGGHTDMDDLPRSPAAVPPPLEGEEGRDVPRWLLQAALDVAAMPRSSQLWRGASQAAQLAASQWKELAAAAVAAGPGAACLLAEALVTGPATAAALGATTAACLECLAELVAATAALQAACPGEARGRQVQVDAVLEQVVVQLVAVGEVPGEPWSLQLLGAAALQPSNWLLHHAASLLTEVAAGDGKREGCGAQGLLPLLPDDSGLLPGAMPQPSATPKPQPPPSQQQQQQQQQPQPMPEGLAGGEATWREALRCWRGSVGHYQDLVGGLWCHPAFDCICSHWGAPPGVAGYPSMPSELLWGPPNLGLIGPVPAAHAEGPEAGAALGGAAGGWGPAGMHWPPLVQQAEWAAVAGLLPALQFMAPGNWVAQQWEEGAPWEAEDVVEEEEEQDGDVIVL